MRFGKNSFGNFRTWFCTAKPLELLPVRLPSSRLQDMSNQLHPIAICRNPGSDEHYPKFHQAVHERLEWRVEHDIPNRVDMGEE
jgi:hypothetical protein